MTRKPDDWMPLRIGEYLADTTHLTRDQHGAYLLLIMAYWRKGEALPDDDGQLAAISKCTAAEWRKMKPIIAAFFQIRDGKWFQKRCEEELAKARSLVEQRSVAGKASAEARERQRKANENSTGVERDNKQTGNENADLLPSTKNQETTHTLPDAVCVDFDRWIAVFPNKTKLVEAKTEFVEALKKTNIDVLIRAAEQYALSIKGKPDRYITNPAKWLHDERWTDGLAPAAPKAPLVEPHPSWNGTQAALVAKVGEAEFSAYFAAAKFDPGPPAMIEVASQMLKSKIESKFRSPLRALFGAVEIAVAKDLNA